MGVKSDIGAEVKVVTSAPPAARTATYNGPAIDVRNFESAVLHVRTGAVTGGPSAISVQSKLQYSADGTGGWADFVPPTPYPGTDLATAPAITAADSEEHLNVNLAGVNYVREVQAIAFTGGTAPAVNTASTLALGGARKTPVEY